MPFSLQDSDIFTDLKKLMSCNYISDIRIGKNRRKASKILKTLNLENYTLLQLSDLYNYLYNKEAAFTDYVAAKKLLIQVIFILIKTTKSNPNSRTDRLGCFLLFAGYFFKQIILPLCLNYRKRCSRSIFGGIYHIRGIIRSNADIRRAF